MLWLQGNANKGDVLHVSGNLFSKVLGAYQFNNGVGIAPNPIITEGAKVTTETQSLKISSPNAEQRFWYDWEGWRWILADNDTLLTDVYKHADTKHDG